MKKILIGSIIAALGGAFGTVYFAVKYRKEVKHHWDTRYKYEDELRETEKSLKGKTNYEACELEWMMDDISGFILDHKDEIKALVNKGWTSAKKIVDYLKKKYHK